MKLDAKAVQRIVAGELRHWVAMPEHILLAWQFLLDGERECWAGIADSINRLAAQPTPREEWRRARLRQRRRPEDWWTRFDALEPRSVCALGESWRAALLREPSRPVVRVHHADVMRHLRERVELP